jgi:WS/DGAT/MGAT family acyltransferase
MHVGALSFFEDTGTNEEEITKHVESRLHLVPRYRQKLAWVPGNQGRPVWIDDRSFDIKNHVLFTGMSRHDSEEGMLRLTSRLLSRPLDRRRPLWEMWVVHLPDNRFALISKSHHCVVDGISAVDIGTAILDLTRDTPSAESQPWSPAAEPSKSRLLVDALWERATQPREMVRTVKAVTRAPRKLLAQGAELARGVLSSAQAGLELAPRTSFTRGIGPHRRFDVVRADLDDLKRVKNELGCTVNDVVLAVVTGALRRLMLSRNEKVDGVVLRAMVPVSVRSDSERNTFGNKISWVFADLPVGLPDPTERVLAVQESMRHLKESRNAIGADFWLKLGHYAPPTVLALAGRAAAFQRMANLVVTNVPGPQFPLFFRGGKLLEAFPVVPIMGVTSLGVAVLSYDGQVNFGLNAEWNLFPDLHVLAKGIHASIEELSSRCAPADCPTLAFASAEPRAVSPAEHPPAPTRRF